MDKDVLQNLSKRFPAVTLPTGNIRLFARASFVHLVKPRVGDDGSEKFEVSLLFPLGYSLSILNEALMASGTKTYGPNVRQLIEAGSVRWPIKDQGKNIDPKSAQLRPGMTPGAKFCAARTTDIVNVVDAQAQRADPRIIYSGCWVLATVDTWAKEYRSKDGKAQSRNISIGLKNVQFVADDERLGGGGPTDPAAEFAPIDGTGDPAAAFAGGGGAKKDEYDFS